MTQKYIHPGEVLLEDFIIPMGLTPYRVAKDIGVPLTRIMAIIKCNRSISADTALRLGIYFGTSPEMWLNLQTGYDLNMARDKCGKYIQDIVKPFNSGVTNDHTD